MRSVVDRRYATTVYLGAPWMPYFTARNSSGRALSSASCVRSLASCVRSLASCVQSSTSCDQSLASCVQSSTSSKRASPSLKVCKFVPHRRTPPRQCAAGGERRHADSPATVRSGGPSASPRDLYAVSPVGSVEAPRSRPGPVRRERSHWVGCRRCWRQNDAILPNLAFAEGRGLLGVACSIGRSVPAATVATRPKGARCPFT